MWVSRSCRPEASYRASTVHYLSTTSSRGLTFKPDTVDWSGIRNMVIGTVTDASHGNEEEFCGVTKELEPYRSQGGTLTILANKELVQENNIKFHLVGFHSGVIKRVCRATFQRKLIAYRKVSNKETC